MRRTHRGWLALFGLLMLLEAGCLRQWNNPNSAHANDPLLQSRGFPPGYPPPPGFTPGSGQPEVLTPQPPPMMEPVPNANGGLPPNASGYNPVPPNGLVPVDQRQAAPAPGPRTNEEPPLAKAGAPGDQPRVRPLPPDLLDRKNGSTIPAAGVPETAPGAPVGITLFSEIKEKAIATGLKPDLEGLDWLKSNKYRTVIHLRRSSTNDSADKEQVERRGMTYVSIEMSADKVSKQTVEQFGKLVNDAVNQPVFVYDRDGVLAGAMWYLHLVLNEKMPAELARGRAELYGLKEKGGDEAAALWAAIQKILKD
jgi:protein tyrosine phosphatase (PTP) superfamily phosphohydrolase (DUF442 family)